MQAVQLQATFRGFLARKKFKQELSEKGKETAKGSLSPFVPSSFEVVELVLQLGEVASSDTVLDIGCGDGRLLVAAAQKPGATGLGVEIDEKLVERARVNAAAAGVSSLVRIEQCDVLSETCIGFLKRATVVFLFLLPRVVESLKQTLLDHLPKGARVLTYTFQVAGWQPDAVAAHKSDMTSVYLYRMPPSLVKAVGAAAAAGVGDSKDSKDDGGGGSSSSSSSSTDSGTAKAM